MNLPCSIPEMLSPEGVPSLDYRLHRGMNKGIPVVASVLCQRVQALWIIKHHSGDAKGLTLWIKEIHRRLKKFLERQVDGMFNNVFHSVSPVASKGTLRSIDLTATCIFGCLMSQPVELI